MDEKDAKKQIPLRLSSSLWKELVAWAEDDFRSLNGQIEFLLTACVRQRMKRGEALSETFSDAFSPPGGDDRRDDRRNDRRIDREDEEP